MSLSIIDIINDELVYPVYQPIFSLKSGNVFGFEGLIRGPKDSFLHSPFMLFKEAEKCNLLSNMDYLARKSVIQSFNRKEKLFLNVNSRIFENEENTIGFTIKQLNEFNIKTEDVVIELTEYANVDDKKLVDKSNYYRDNFFQIAIDDFGTGNSDMKRFLEIRPNILKLDKSLITGVETNRFKSTIVKAFINISKANGIKTVAEGIETMETLEYVIKLGVDYGQGYLLSKEVEDLNCDFTDSKDNILYFQNIHNMINDQKKNYITSITSKYPSFNNSDYIKTADEYFQSVQTYRSIPVVNSMNLPVGLLTRYHLNMILSRRYGRDVYLRKQIHSIMDKTPLIVSSDLLINEVAEYAMNRTNDRVYQDIIVIDYETNEYIGIVTIKNLLDHQLKVEMERAKNSNPLTNLPGNATINEQLDSVKNMSEVHILYFDLDNFKYFNDKYGFDIGDKVILSFAHILNETIMYETNNENFLGHIGGDDFLAIINLKKENLNVLFNKIFERYKKYMNTLFPNEKYESLSTISIACLYVSSPSMNYTKEYISQKLSVLKTQAKTNRFNDSIAYE